MWLGIGIALASAAWLAIGFLAFVHYRGYTGRSARLVVDLNPADFRPPFPVKRVCCVYETTAERVGHAYRNVRQLAQCLAGTCTFMLDDGAERFRVRLSRPEDGLLIGPAIWREIAEITPDCVLVVYASESYDEADYIRDFDEFRRQRPLLLRS